MKYKLIKEYPGSPKLGFTTNESHYLGIGDYITGNQRLNPKDYPEFWQEVVEKDYEILSFRTSCDYGKTWKISRKISNGRFLLETLNEKDLPLPVTLGDGMGATEKYMLNEWKQSSKEKCEIHSIKRLSDGEIFTVGDKVDSTISDLGRATDLTGLKIINNQIKFGLRELGYYPLNTIIKIKKPLFTTEDGIDIFERNHPDLYCVSLNHYYITGIHSSSTLYDLDLENFKYFSTKEVAEEYILMNKPCLSISDVLKLQNKWSIKTIDKLKELVKNK